MKHKTIFFVGIAALILVSSQARSGQINAIDPVIEAKIDALLAKMTLEEKVGQMTQPAPVDPDDPDDPNKDRLEEDVIEEEVRKGRAGSFLNLGDLDRRIIGITGC